MNHKMQSILGTDSELSWFERVIVSGVYIK